MHRARGPILLAGYADANREQKHGVCFQNGSLIETHPRKGKNGRNLYIVDCPGQDIPHSWRAAYLQGEQKSEATREGSE